MIEAMVFSSLTNIPTINGYSGTSSDTIERNWIDLSDYASVWDYINRINLSSMGCLFSNQTVDKLSQLSTLNIHFQEEVSPGNQETIKSGCGLQIKMFLYNYEII